MPSEPPHTWSPDDGGDPSSPQAAPSESPHTWYLDEGGDPAAPRAVAVERYTLRGELGRGGFGRVLLAWDHALEREVAIKEVHVDAPSSAVRRFLGEAKLTASLEHPNIIPVHDAGERPDGSLYYVMRLIRGRTLLDAIQQAPTLADRLALLSHLEDVVQAMSYAHARGVLHRDIKPANIMLGEHGETLLVDWGIARTLDSYRAGQVEGTPAYMSPEQAKGQPADERADVWSLGAVLFEMLAGVPPYHGADPDTLLQRVRTQAPPRVRDLVPEAPAELAAIVARALQVDPVARYPSARELAKDLVAWRDGRRVGAFQYSPFQALRLLVRRYRLPLAALGAGVAVAVVVAVVSFARVRAERDRAVLAEQGMREALADSLIGQASQAAEARQWLRAALLSVEALGLREDPRARGWLALSLHAPAWTLERVPKPEPCLDLQRRGPRSFCRVADGVAALTPSSVGAPTLTWTHSLPGATPAEASGSGDRMLAIGRERMEMLDGEGRVLASRPAPRRAYWIEWSPDDALVAHNEGTWLAIVDRDGAERARLDLRSSVQFVAWQSPREILAVVASGWVTRVAVQPREDGTIDLQTVSACNLGASVTAAALSPGRDELFLVGFDQLTRRASANSCELLAQSTERAERVRQVYWLSGPDLVVGLDEVGGVWTFTPDVRLLDRRQVGPTVLRTTEVGPDELLVYGEQGTFRLRWREDRLPGRVPLGLGPNRLARVGRDLRLWAGKDLYALRLDSVHRSITSRDGPLVDGFAEIPGGSAWVGGARLWIERGRRRLSVEVEAPARLDWHEGLALLVLDHGDHLELVDLDGRARGRVPLPADRRALLPAGEGWWVQGKDLGWTEVSTGDHPPRPVEASEGLIAVDEREGRRVVLRDDGLWLDGSVRIREDGAWLTARWLTPTSILLVGLETWEIVDLAGASRALLPAPTGRPINLALYPDALLAMSWDGELRAVALDALDIESDAARRLLRRRHGARIEGARETLDLP